MSESAGIPFVQIGNRRGLTAQQLTENPWIKDFVKRFAQCFEADPSGDFYLFIEPEGENV